jgi:hypothetical protein
MDSPILSQPIKFVPEYRAIIMNLKSATIIQYTIKGRFMNR